METGVECLGIQESDDGDPEPCRGEDPVRSRKVGDPRSLSLVGVFLLLDWKKIRSLYQVVLGRRFCAIPCLSHLFHFLDVFLARTGRASCDDAYCAPLVGVSLFGSPS